MANPNQSNPHTKNERLPAATSLKEKEPAVLRGGLASSSFLVDPAPFHVMEPWVSTTIIISGFRLLVNTQFPRGGAHGNRTHVSLVLTQVCSHCTSAPPGPLYPISHGLANHRTHTKKEKEPAGTAGIFLLLGVRFPHSVVLQTPLLRSILIISGFGPFVNTQFVAGAPDRTRTCNLSLRKGGALSTELRGHRPNYNASHSV